MWLEMVRDPVSRAGGWGFSECLWSPAHKKAGKGRWPYWEALLAVRKGDLVLHLKGEGKSAGFVGWSVAEFDGYSTSERPPKPGQWAYATNFYRVPLHEYQEFPVAVNLREVFELQESELRAYFTKNGLQPRSVKELLFFVIQNGELQCQNGAYLSHLSSPLASILFGSDFSTAPGIKKSAAVSTKTGTVLQEIARRQGQKQFSDNVRDNYGSKCCFPDCTIAESNLLVGSHIARWADAPSFRGETSNGLCLCLLHDRAFEKGWFTVSDSYRIYVNKQKAHESPWAKANLYPHDGKSLILGTIKPSVKALQQHWLRVKCEPA